MRNDMIVKATWVINEKGINEIYFDYVNKEGNYVGNIIVGENGSFEWHIIDMSYLDDIFKVIQFINGKPTIDRLENVMNDLDNNRWEKAKLYIKSNNLILNRYQANYYNDDKKIIR